MSGEFNIAVAGFQYVGQSNDVANNYDVAHTFYSRIVSDVQQLRQQTNFVVDMREPALSGTISGQSDTERELAAEALAHSIGADVVVYGTVAVENGQMIVTPRFFVNQESFYNASELVGDYRLGSRISMPLSLDADDKRQVNEILSARSAALSYIVLGLMRYAKYDYKVALDRFQHAAALATWTEGREVLYILMGYAAINQKQLVDAKHYCDMALEANVQYARAYLCAANVLYQQALLGRTTPEQIDPTDIDRAIALFKRAGDASEQPQSADIPLKVQLALGQAYLVKSYRAGGDYRAKAQDAFDFVIEAYGKEPAKQYRRQELVAEAYGERALINRIEARVGDAIADYTHAYELSKPPERKALFADRIGDIFARRNDAKNAILWYERAVGALPPDSEKRKEYQRQLDGFRQAQATPST
jgi:tetratricopeptide (TPR) repeat protein